MKKMNLKKLIPAVLVLFVLFVIPFYGSDKIDYSKSFVEFGIHGMNMNWGYTSSCFATLQRTANGHTLLLTARDQVYHDTIKITIELTGEAPWDSLRNSSKIVILYAGRTYQGYVTVYLDDPIPEVGGLVTAILEDSTLTWVGMDITIPVASGKISLVRVK